MEIRVLLLDIEGTTTPISFVHDVLFPYAAAHAETFLRNSFDDPAVEADRRALAALAGGDADSIADVLGVVAQLMADDVKSTPLKSLQGKIWREGYLSGTLEGAVFDDVPALLRDARRAGVRVCIYSSGSVSAQRLLFKHSSAGDLSSSIDAYFDTTTGPKKAPTSYQTIARVLNVAPAHVLFGTDNLEEAEAAREAGMRAVVLDRPGNAPLPPHDFETWQTLEPLRDLFAASH